MRSALMAVVWALAIFSGDVVQAAWSYLNNGTINLGVDLSKGGAISWLSQSGSSYSVVNTADLGRHIQQSYYSGPQPFSPPGVPKSSRWADFPWNAVQAGDCFGFRSQILNWSNTGSQLYVKTRPMQWALRNYPADCNMEQWITLSGNVATVRNRLTMSRSDVTWYGAYDQELPAVYTISALDRLTTYKDLQPFTSGSLSTIPNTGSWINIGATENWVAFVNSSNWGLGVFHPGCVRFWGGMAGSPGGGPTSSSTGYIAPIKPEILDHNLVYDYSYNLILGDISNIRSYVYANKPENRPNYVFDGDRQHWRYANATDTGAPIGDHLHVQWSAGDPMMLGPSCAFQAADVDKIYIRAAYNLTGADTAQLFWERNGGADPVSQAQSQCFSIINDGQYHTYAIDLSAHPYWAGEISGLRFDPASVGGSMDIQYISCIIPEPSANILLMTGLMGLLAYGRRRLLGFAVSTGRLVSPT